MIRQQPFSGNEPRWLNPDTAAAYIGVRVERLRPMVKAGKLPPPSYHLGPNQPRYDRLALDRVFSGEGAAAYNPGAIVQGAIDRIIERGRKKQQNGQESPRRRHR
jgi:hypothetical protein